MAHCNVLSECLSKLMTYSKHYKQLLFSVMAFKRCALIRSPFPFLIIDILLWFVTHTYTHEISIMGPSFLCWKISGKQCSFVVCIARMYVCECMCEFVCVRCMKTIIVDKNNSLLM